MMKGLIMLLCSVFIFQIHAQDIAGDWHGKLSYQGIELQLVFHITGQNGAYQSTMDSPDQGAAGIVVDKTTFENGKITIEVSALQVIYTAEMDEKGMTLSGTFNQQGIQLPLLMTKKGEVKSAMNPQGMDDAKKVLGDWHGILDLSETQLLIVFHIMDVDGQMHSTMDSPDQNTNGIQMDETTFIDGRLKIVAKAMNAEYLAELTGEGDTLKGTFTQGGRSWDLVMTGEMVERQAVVRPQEPKEFPYLQEDVKFENPKGGHYLAGTLTMPQDGVFEKVVILISGSGPQDRNEEVLNHKPFLVLSDHLTRAGVAVLRYDDRGVAESEGTFAGATTKDFADDAAAAVTYLKSRKEMSGKAIGLVGHSEGGMIAPIVASEHPDIDFIVLLAGPGIDIQELLLMQQDRAAEADGVSAATRETMDKMAKETFAYIENNTHLTKDQLRAGISQLAGKGYEQLSDEAKQQIGDKENFMNQQSRMLSSDWYLYLMRFSPDQFLSKVKCPVLAVNGEFDLQVSSKENLKGIRESLKRANNNNVTIHEFNGLNHLFQKTKTGAPSEYGTLEETFNEEAMAYISNWILALGI
jgi:hypothetical protein